LARLVKKISLSNEEELLAHSSFEVLGKALALNTALFNLKNLSRMFAFNQQQTLYVQF